MGAIVDQVKVNSVWVVWRSIACRLPRAEQRVDSKTQMLYVFVHLLKNSQREPTAHDCNHQPRGSTEWFLFNSGYPLVSSSFPDTQYGF
jgi:hypothetical protein